MKTEFEISNNEKEAFKKGLIEKFCLSNKIFNLSEKIIEKENRYYLDIAWVKEFIKILKEMKIKNNTIHKNSCGKPIIDNLGNVIISCGDDLSGNNNEFAQCNDCRIRDFIDELVGGELK